MKKISITSTILNRRFLAVLTALIPGCKLNGVHNVNANSKVLSAETSALMNSEDAASSFGVW